MSLTCSCMPIVPANHLALLIVVVVAQASSLLDSNDSNWLERLPAGCSLSSGGGERSTLFEGLVEGASHVEGVLGVLVTSTGQEGAETIDG